MIVGSLNEGMIKTDKAMKMMKSLIFVAVLIAGQFATAQCEDGWCWGAEPDKAKEKNALYTDAYKVGNNAEAAMHLEWLLENTPNLNKSIYINGAKIYEDLANTEADAVKKRALETRTLEMYDLRIKYFNDEPDVLNRKAYVAYKLLKDDQGKYKELLALFDKAYELNKSEFFANNLAAYMDVMRRYKAVGNPLTDQQIFERYFNITDVIDAKAARGDAVPKSIADFVDKMLLDLVPQIDCSIVIKDFGPKFEANPDINMAKKIFKMMLTGKCTDDPLALKAAKMVDDNEPSYGIKIFIAGRAVQNNDMATAISYFEQALPLTDENVKKGDIYLKIAKLKGGQGMKSTAREYAQKALDVDPSLSDAYKYIGDLYMNSFDDCASKSDIVQDRAVFIAAYDMYRRAGDGSAMAKAKAQFPSSEELFTASYEVGQQMRVNCWINTTITLDRRN
jgi:tetratricopeptide (TPR) repeat protein